MENLILFCGNNAQGDERIMNILEIVVLMLREQVNYFLFRFENNFIYYSQQKN